MVCRSPVAVAVEQTSNQASIEDSGKSLILRIGLPVAHDFITHGKTPYMQAAFVPGTTSEADVSGCKSLLKGFSALSHVATFCLLMTVSTPRVRLCTESTLNRIETKTNYTWSFSLTRAAGTLYQLQYSNILEKSNHFGRLRSSHSGSYMVLI